MLGQFSSKFYHVVHPACVILRMITMITIIIIITIIVIIIIMIMIIIIIMDCCLFYLFSFIYSRAGLIGAEPGGFGSMSRASSIYY